MVAALDRDAEQRGYDAVRVVELGLQTAENADVNRHHEAIALDRDDEVIGRFPVSGYSASVDVTAVRGHDWDVGDLDYRERLWRLAIGHAAPPGR